MIGSLAVQAAERGLLSDRIIRSGIQRLCRRRQRDLPEDHARSDWLASHLTVMEDSTIAAVPDSANRQHYEVPAEFFQASLGPKLKYSSCLWNKAMTLAEAEIEALAETCVHADLQDGQSILELGCGWGSLTLWMAEKYPHATITGVSNSASQRHYIEGQCRSRGLSNVTILTADMNDFDVDGRFDRVVSIEMFEHMRNWRTLLSRVRRWVHPDGRLMIHVFCHASDPYLFQDRLSVVVKLGGE